MVVVAQLVRASVCGTEGRGFEPHHPPKKSKGCAYFVQPFLLPPLFVAKVAPLHTTFFLGGYPSHCAATAAQWEGSGLPACRPLPLALSAAQKGAQTIGAVPNPGLMS